MLFLDLNWSLKISQAKLQNSTHSCNCLYEEYRYICICIFFYRSRFDVYRVVQYAHGFINVAITH